MEAGIEVEMFDAEFQEIIYSENKDFLDQALERTAEVKKPKEIVLSPLEKPVAAADLTELSDEALNLYSNRSGMNLPVDAPEFLAHLQQRQLIELDAMDNLVKYTWSSVEKKLYTSATPYERIGVNLRIQ